MNSPSRLIKSLLRFLIIRPIKSLLQFLPKNVQKYLMIISLRLYWKFSEYLGMIVFLCHDNMSPKHIYNWGVHHFFLKHVNKDMTILDIGCGEGFLTKKVSLKVRKVLAYDSSSRSIETAKRKNDAVNIKYFVGDALKNLPKGRYDVVILSSILTFIEDPELFLNKLHELTDTLLIRETRYDSHYFVLLAQEFGIKKSGYYEYTKKELVNKLEKTNWEVIESWDTYDIFLKVKTKTYF